MKRCKKCGEEKELSEFYACKNGKGGKRSFCKKCFYLSNKQNPCRKPEVRSIYMKKWLEDHPESQNAYVRKCRESGTPSYIAQALRIPLAQLTPELLELKRAQLEMYRLTKQLKKEIQNGN